MQIYGFSSCYARKIVKICRFIMFNDNENDDETTSLQSMRYTLSSPFVGYLVPHTEILY